MDRDSVSLTRRLICADRTSGRGRCSATLASRGGCGRTIRFAIRALTDETLAAMERELAALYSGLGRPSIAPQMLLRAMLLQAFYSVRSERQLMERMEFDLLFRWPHPELVEGRRAGRRRAGVGRLDLLEEQGSPARR